MNQIFKKLLLVGDKVIPEMYLRRHILLLVHLLKTKKKFKNLIETKDSRLSIGMI